VKHRTDYSRIAERYDSNPTRHKIAAEPLLEGSLDAMPRILDIGCGTGNWIAAQRDYYPDLKAVWLGVDASPEMLAVAKAKLVGTDLAGENLVLGRAEDLPFGDGSIRFAASNFAYHHFDDLSRAMAEAHRVLCTGGILVLTNVCPEHMDDWWVYRFFPSTRAIDDARFPANQVLFDLLREVGFATELTTTVRTAERPAQPILEEALNRDISQLTLIDDVEYAAGIEKIRDRTTVAGSVALIRIVARNP
jgi:ubiquinone/menaquinone biosynthesis C-methylase UbiE